MPRSISSSHNKGKQLLEELGRVQYLRLDSLTDKVGEHAVDYRLGSALISLTEPGEDGYSPLEKIAIKRGYKDIIEAYRRAREEH